MQAQPGELEFLVMCHPGCHWVASKLFSMVYTMHFSPDTGHSEERLHPYMVGDL